MKKILGEYSKYFMLSLTGHGVLLALLLLNLDTHLVSQRAAASPVDIVQAVVVDEEQVSAEVERLRSAEKQQKLAQEAQQKQLAQKLEKIKQEQAQEQAKLLQLKQDMAKAKQEAQKALSALDDQRQAEQDRVQALRIQREKEEKKRAETAKKQPVAKRTAEEGKHLTAAKAAKEARVDAEVARVFALWREKIEMNRREVFGMDPDLSCEVIMNVLPDGSVQVNLTKKSGNPIYDEVSVKAIQKSEPFQLPDDPHVREKLKSIKVTFKGYQGI